MHHGLLFGRPRAAPAQRRRGRGPQSARRAGARRRHGVPALHAGSRPDRGRKSRRQSRRRAGRHRMAQGDEGARSFPRPDAVSRAARQAGLVHGGRREAEARNSEAALSRPAIPHPGRTDLGVDTWRGRRNPRPAARHGARKYDHRHDDQPQVSRGRGVLRRLHGAETRRAGSAAARSAPSRRERWRR